MEKSKVKWKKLSKADFKKGIAELKKEGLLKVKSFDELVEGEKEGYKKGYEDGKCELLEKFTQKNICKACSKKIGLPICTGVKKKSFHCVVLMTIEQLKEEAK